MRWIWVAIVVGVVAVAAYLGVKSMRPKPVAQAPVEPKPAPPAPAAPTPAPVEAARVEPPPPEKPAPAPKTVKPVRKAKPKIETAKAEPPPEPVQAPEPVKPPAPVKPVETVKAPEPVKPVAPTPVVVAKPAPVELQQAVVEPEPPKPEPIRIEPVRPAPAPRMAPPPPPPVVVAPPPPPAPAPIAVVPPPPAPVVAAPPPAPAPAPVAVAPAPPPVPVVLAPPAPPPVEVAKAAPPPPSLPPAPVVKAPAARDVAPASYAADQTSAVIAAAVFGDSEPAQDRGPKVAAKLMRSRDLPQAMDSMAVEMTKGVPAGKSLAVASIAALDNESRDAQIGAITSEMLTTRAIQLGTAKIAEQAQVNRVMDELQMSSLGLTEERDMTKAGLVLGVDYVVAGTARNEGRDTVLTFTKVETASGRAVGSWEMRVPAVAAQSYLGDRVERRSRYDSLWRSSLMPGWGQFYNEQNVRGGIYVASAFTLVGLTAYQYGRFTLATEDYQNATSENESATAFAKAESMRSQAYLLMGITAGFWIFNAVDAYFGGREETIVKKQVEFGAAPMPNGGLTAAATLRW